MRKIIAVMLTLLHSIQVNSETVAPQPTAPSKKELPLYTSEVSFNGLKRTYRYLKDIPDRPEKVFLWFEPGIKQGMIVVSTGQPVCAQSIWASYEKAVSDMPGFLVTKVDKLENWFTARNQFDLDKTYRLKVIPDPNPVASVNTLSELIEKKIGSRCDTVVFSTSGWTAFKERLGQRGVTQERLDRLQTSVSDHLSKLGDVQQTLSKLQQDIAKPKTPGEKVSKVWTWLEYALFALFISAITAFLYHYFSISRRLRRLDQINELSQKISALIDRKMMSAGFTERQPAGRDPGELKEFVNNTLLQSISRLNTEVAAQLANQNQQLDGFIEKTLEILRPTNLAPTSDIRACDYSGKLDLIYKSIMRLGGVLHQRAKEIEILKQQHLNTQSENINRINAAFKEWQTKVEVESKRLEDDKKQLSDKLKLTEKQNKKFLDSLIARGDIKSDETDASLEERLNYLANEPGSWRTYRGILQELRAYLNANGQGLSSTGFFRACGLDKVDQVIEEQLPYYVKPIDNSGTEQDRLGNHIHGIWHSFLSPLFRAEALLRAYWPDDDPNTRAVATVLDGIVRRLRTIMKPLDLEPDDIHLLDSLAPGMELSRGAAGVVVVDRALRDSSRYKEIIQKIKEKIAEKKQITVDITQWGLKKGGKSLSPTKVITMDAQQAETFLATNR